MRFAEIPDQTKVKQLLVQSVQRRHVAHAQLFRGAEGSAALGLALAYATFLNCEGRTSTDGDSCGHCPACQKLDKLVHPDLNFIVPVTSTKQVPKDAVSSKFAADWRTFVLENPYQGLNDWMQHIGAENKQGSISKEESLQLLKLVSLKAFEGRFKIVLIWLPELMHPAASNAVLKLLEEPPSATIFLLVSHAPEQLLPTIISRVQPVVVRPFTEDELTAYLHDEQHIPEAKARQLAQIADGNLGAALAARTAPDNDYFTFFTEWMRLCFQDNFAKVLEKSDEFQKMGRENQKEFLHYALGLLRKVLLYGLDAQLIPHLPAAEQQFVSRFSRFVHPGNAESITTELNDAHYHVERNANPRMVFVDTSLRVAELLKIPV
ncbi:DNA polymerase III gamma/tau subunits-like [Hymenobacter roseosalivarius DSM 11622]|uniref:DNA polymerase III gamma/tau subunits-like n=1 Tax=Hymenobacter roseosalivarius DSM 11622 TaxID=645990 RepID=A0A1W1VU15_9BACT|nr:DNA polymerase III subunit delta' [Hymenobacter roseosalivarius]SMB96730.1 DNA polymerase III gamma/tau subunits-like [Hymenobacter roseosalivarius DSM 11622]